MSRHPSTHALHANRRHFLTGAAAAGGALGMPLAQAAAGVDENELAGSVENLVVLYDSRLVDEAALTPFAARGARCIALTGDPVQLWRSGDAAAVLAAPGSRLLGMSRWADLLIVRGLAAESGRHLQSQRFDRATGVFTWLIA